MCEGGRLCVLRVTVLTAFGDLDPMLFSVLGCLERSDGIMLENGPKLLAS